MDQGGARCPLLEFLVECPDLSGSGEKFVRFASCALPAASKERRHPPVAHLAFVALPGLILSNA